MAEEQKTSLKEIEKTSKESETKPEEAGKEEITSTAAAVEARLEEPKVEKKRFRLPFFGRKKSEAIPEADNQVEKKDDNKAPSKPLTPVDLVNNLDGDIKVLTQSKIDELTHELDKQIEEIGKPQVTVSLTKKTLLLSMGLVLGILWAVLLGQFILKNQIIENVKAKFAKPEETVFEATESATVSEDEVKSASASAKSVRIKDKSNKSQEVRDLATLLESNGYEYVEIVEDETITQTKLTVLTKKETDSEVPIISNLLKDLYEIDQGVSELTQDSDFGIVILFPENPEKIE